MSGDLRHDGCHKVLTTQICKCNRIGMGEIMISTSSAVANRLSQLVLACGLAATSMSAASFQVLPKISDVDRKLTSLGSNWMIDSVGHFFIDRGIPMIKSPVHESIVLGALGCVVPPGSERTCITSTSVLTHRAMLYGVRWPDDPPFQLNRDKPPRTSNCDVRVTLRSTSQPACWKTLFSDAQTTALVQAKLQSKTPAFSPGDYLLSRSHFGDLQFFHSMAAYDGEEAQVTKLRMKMWAQFLWGIATQTLPKDKFLRTLDVPGLAEYFPGDQSAINLLATGIVEVRKDLHEVAVGALLHMIQDSFSHAHAERTNASGGTCEAISRFNQPGRIKRFFGYAGQNGDVHDHEDTFDALEVQTMQDSPTVVDVSRAFISLWKEGAPWTEAEKYFDCVFTLQDPAAVAGPGAFTGSVTP